MHNLIILVLLLLVVGLTFSVVHWKGGMHMTFSQHVATNRTATIYYSLLFFITLPILITFFATWYVHKNHLTYVFLWFAVTSSFFQILCTFFPENGGTNTKIHRFLTGISGITLLPLMIIIGLSSHFSNFVHYISWVALSIMLILLSIALKNQNDYRYALLLQIGYYAAFFITILISSYT